MTKKLGHYEIIRELGRGGMGVVYLAKDSTLDRQVAIKVLSQPINEDDVMVKRFMREARSAASLNHPNIIQVYFIGQEGDKHYFVMEFVKGQSLSDWIHKNGVMEPEEAAQVILQSASGLAAAHDAGIFHRDIKPSNLILNEDGIVKIADFGIAFKQEMGQKLTATGQFLGTPGYLCPEICLGEPTDQRSDIFSLGIVFFELLTGFSPFEAESPMAMMHKVVTSEVPDVTSINTKVSPKLTRILCKMVEKDREKRYQNCHDLQADLEAFLGIRRSQIGTRPYVASAQEKTMAMAPPPPVPPPVAQPTPESVPPPPVSLAPPVRQPSGKKNLVWLWVCLLVVLMGIGVTAMVYLLKGWNSSDDHPTSPSEVVSSEIQALKDEEPSGTLESSQMIVQKDKGFDTESASAEIGEERVEDETPLEEKPASIPSTQPVQVETTHFEERTQPGTDGSHEASSSPSSGGAVPDSTPSRSKSPSQVAMKQGSANQAKKADQPATAPDELEGLTDLFRTGPVDLPKGARLKIIVQGDDILAEPLAQAIQESGEAFGFRVTGDEVLDSTDANEIPMLRMLRQERIRQDEDILILVRIISHGKLGIEYGQRGTSGYRVNTICRVRASLFLPKQNRLGLAPWSKSLNYNVQTAEGEARDLASQMKEEWFPTIDQAMVSEKAPILLAGKGDEIVSDAILYSLEKELQEHGYPVFCMNDLGLNADTLDVVRLKRRTGARILCQLNATYLSQESISAYGQQSMLLTYRLKTQILDLERPGAQPAKNSSLFRFSGLGLEGEADLFAKEWFEKLKGDLP